MDKLKDEIVKHAVKFTEEKGKLELYKTMQADIAAALLVEGGCETAVPFPEGFGAKPVKKIEAKPKLAVEEKDAAKKVKAKKAEAEAELEEFEKAEGSETAVAESELEKLEKEEEPKKAEAEAKPEEAEKTKEAKEAEAEAKKKMVGELLKQQYDEAGDSNREPSSPPRPTQREQDSPCEFVWRSLAETLVNRVENPCG